MNQSKAQGYLQSIYLNSRDAIQKEFNITNVQAIPVIDKVVVSMRLGRDASDKKAVAAAFEELAKITGQKAAVSYAKKSIAGFKLREGQVSGAYCTLRREQAFYFLERLFFLALPRVRDFRGFRSKSLDNQFNLNFGIKDHLIFEELDYDSVYRARGLDVSIRVKNSTSADMTIKLLRLLSCPVRK